MVLGLIFSAVVIAIAAVVAYRLRRSWVIAAIVGLVGIMLAGGGVTTAFEDDARVDDAIEQVDALAVLALIVVVVYAVVRRVSRLRGRDLALAVIGALFLLAAVPMTIVEGWEGVGPLVLAVLILVVPAASLIGRAERSGSRVATVDGERAVVIDGLRSKVWMGRLGLRRLHGPRGGDVRRVAADRHRHHRRVRRPARVEPRRGARALPARGHA